jgi:hypothetical protein
MFGAGQDANIGYDGTNMIFNTNVTGSGLAWFSNNVSATGYITRTDVFDKSESVSALDYIKDAEDYLTTDGKVNHSAFEYSAVSYDKQVIDKITDYTITHLECINETTGEIGEEIIKQVCEDVPTTYQNITYKTIKEEGVSLDKEVALLKQSIYELKVQNEYLQQQVNSLTGQDIVLNEVNRVQDEAICSIKIFDWCIK